MAIRKYSKYSGRILVRLPPPVVATIAARAQNPALPDWPNLQQLSEDVGLPQLQALLQRYPPCPSYPAVRGTRVARILEREERARATEFVPARSLTAYFILDPRSWRKPALSARLLADLNALPNQEVELAYREFGVKPPKQWAVDPGDPFVPDQGYLDAAPRGIGAKTPEVWGSFSGAAIRFVDLETGWNLGHVDLPRSVAGDRPIRGVNDRYEADHGTSVLGIVLGQPNGAGITGIAPRADFRGVSSYMMDLRTLDVDIPGAIYAAMEELEKGDVLLLEVQTGDGYPIESDEVIQIAITEASAEGFVVIEPAGNGTDVVGRDLDKQRRQIPGDPPPVTLKPGAPGFRDSGAVMVSACRSSVTRSGGHRRLGFGGYGSRVDCYAWGENVVTSGGGDFGPAKGPNREYTDTFWGTSSASAIIAGAALLVQQMAWDKRHARLTPTQMRARLAGVATGTSILKPKGNVQLGRVMPDLRRIARTL